MSWRILHVGLGPLGRRIARELHQRGLGEVGAAVDLDPALTGAPLPEVIDAGSPGVCVTDDLSATIADGRFDAAVVTTSSDLATCADTFRALLGAGISTVSTCEELLFPTLRHAELSEELDTLARRHGAGLLGTGVNPGFLMDSLPAFATAVCRSVNSVEVIRVQDASTRRVPFQRKIGAAHDDAAFEARRAEGSLRHVGLGESLFFLADAVGIEIEDWEETLEPVRAPGPISCEVGEIAEGGISGVRQVATGKGADGRTVRLEFVAAVGQADPHDTARIKGEPDLELTFPSGVHGDDATCAITLNAIDSLKRAGPGLHTMSSIPLVRCVGPRS
ncbi:MAG: dihydrodipicolinate reductase [Planctomycetota bacterium]